jgi:hypothetical protein
MYTFLLPSFMTYHPIWLIVGFLTRITRRVPSFDQELSVYIEGGWGRTKIYLLLLTLIVEQSIQGKFEDTKGVIIIRTSKDRLHGPCSLSFDVRTMITPLISASLWPLQSVPQRCTVSLQWPNVWRYQRGNHSPCIDGHTTMAKSLKIPKG